MKQETLGHWFNNNHGRIERLNRRLRSKVDIFSVGIVPPRYLEDRMSIPTSYVDEYGRVWYPLRHHGRKQFTVSQLLIGSGVPVAPIVRRLSADMNRVQYLSYRFTNGDLEEQQKRFPIHDTMDDIWASDFILRAVFFDIDRAVLEGSENNVEKRGSSYYFHDFDAADLYATKNPESMLTDRLEVYKEYYNNTALLLALFDKKLSTIKEHLQKPHVPELIREAMKDSSGDTCSLEEAEKIQQTLLNRVMAAELWCEKQGK
jgi:hypothetical protein